MNKIKHGILFLMMLSTIAACNSSSGSVSISKSEALNKNLAKHTIYYFEPEVTCYEIGKQANQNILLADELLVHVKERMKKDSRKHKFSIRFFSEEKTEQINQLYINQLMLLKTEVEQVTVLQDNPLNKSARYAYEMKQNVFVYPPRISPEYTSLSDALGTPYIGLCGFFSVKSHPETPEAKAFVRYHPSITYGNYSYFYHIIVNVETSQIEYREIKYIPAVTRKQYIDPVVYDSYAALMNNLK